MVLVRPYREADHDGVRELFIRVNRLLAPATMRDAFEAYVASSLEQEIDRMAEYYAERGGSFWIAAEGDRLAGMFGLERVDEATAELRRMYVDPDFRRQGIARAMLRHAEQICRDGGYAMLTLSTSELQPAALALYRNAGYRLAKEEVVEAQTNKMVGGGVRRFYFAKGLR